MHTSMRYLTVLLFGASLLPTSVVAREAGPVTGTIQVSGYVLGSCRTAVGTTTTRCSSPARVMTVSDGGDTDTSASSAPRVQVTPVV